MSLDSLLLFPFSVPSGSLVPFPHWIVGCAFSCLIPHTLLPVCVQQRPWAWIGFQVASQLIIAPSTAETGKPPSNCYLFLSSCWHIILTVCPLSSSWSNLIPIVLFRWIGAIPRNRQNRGEWSPVQTFSLSLSSLFLSQYLCLVIRSILFTNTDIKGRQGLSAGPQY